jgi:hypothetical protein
VLLAAWAVRPIPGPPPPIRYLPGSQRPHAARAQEFLGHADMETNQVYAYCAPSKAEAKILSTAFSLDITRDERAIRTEV